MPRLIFAAPLLIAIALSLAATLPANGEGTSAPAPSGLASYADPPQALRYLRPGRGWSAPMEKCPSGHTTLNVFKWNGDGGFAATMPEPDRWRFKAPGLGNDGVIFNANTGRFRNVTSVPVMAAFWCNQ